MSSIFDLCGVVLSPSSSSSRSKHQRLSKGWSGRDEAEEFDNDASSVSTCASLDSFEHCNFPSEAVGPWVPERFQLLHKLEDAKSNHGEVLLMRDVVSQKLVAVKQVPIQWSGSSHSDFEQKHPAEPESIWVDIGCAAFLERASFPYVCRLLGVYRDEACHSGMLSMVSEYADRGDLFNWCAPSAGLPPPGPEREAAVRPIARQLFDALRRLHDLGIVHGDVSLENVLLDSSLSLSTPGSGLASGDQALKVKLIDFGRSSLGNRFRSGCVGKPSYKAPEMYTTYEHDGFLADAFAAGVVLYSMLAEGYPWGSTNKGTDKGFDYHSRHGLRALLDRRNKSSKGDRSSSVAMSDAAVELLTGLLAIDPKQRLSLGGGDGIRATRESVWESAWLTCTE